MNSNIEQRNRELADLGALASGIHLVRIFGDVALVSWEGAEALIDAYVKLADETGEPPSSKYIDDELYLVIKGYWNERLGIEKLEKLDWFLSSIE